MRLATTRLSTGPRIHYAAHGEDDGAPVVFLHGWPDSGFSFSRVMPLLPARLRAFAPDQRGFGDSERPERGYRVRDFGEDAAAFLDALRIERASVVGHSFGSFVARRFALAHPERVDRLVLIGSALSAANPVTAEVRASLADLVDPLPLKFVRDFQSGTAHVPLPETFFERIVQESFKAPARVWRDVFEDLLRYDDAADLSRLAAPTLLIWGERDALFSRAGHDALAAAIPGVRVEVYRDTGHCPNWERPERVAASLEAFLS
ncbi:MAG: alpha/beta hydrolase [Thermoanaerobaculia bacterium]